MNITVNQFWHSLSKNTLFPFGILVLLVISNAVDYRLLFADPVLLPIKTFVLFNEACVNGSEAIIAGPNLLSYGKTPEYTHKPNLNHPEIIV